MPKLSDPDAFYRALIEMHEGLSDEESRALNARLILLMAERIADEAELWSVLRVAAASGQTGMRRN